MISLLLLPAYMRFFPDQQILGLWFTSLSVLSWFLTFDLGIGNGLRNSLVKAFANNDNAEVSRLISSTYLIVGLIVLLITLLGNIGFYFIDWNFVFNLSDKVLTNSNLLEVIRIIFIGIMLQFFFRLITSVLYAMQQAAIPNLLTLTSNILLLLFLNISHKEDMFNNLKKLAYANIVIANLPMIIATIYVFTKKISFSVISLKNFKVGHANEVMKLGGMFLCVQIMYMLISNTNEYLITWTTSGKYVVEYKIYNSLFGIVGTIFLLALTPIWSEVTEAHVKKDFQWIKSLYYSLYKIAILCVLALIAMIILFPIAVDMWLGSNKVSINYKYSIVFAVSGIFYLWNAILSSLANGIGKLKVSIIFITFGAILNIPLSYLFTDLTHSWIGVIVANIISIFPYCLAQAIWLNRYFRRECKSF